MQEAWSIEADFFPEISPSDLLSLFQMSFKLFFTSYIKNSLCVFLHIFVCQLLLLLVTNIRLVSIIMYLKKCVKCPVETEYHRKCVSPQAPPWFLDF